MRSAERGPTPGICRNCAIKSRIDDGYSVFLKTDAPLLVQRRIGQLQGERLEPAEIQLQRTIFFTLGAARVFVRAAHRTGPDVDHHRTQRR